MKGKKISKNFQKKKKNREAWCSNMWGVCVCVCVCMILFWPNHLVTACPRSMKANIYQEIHMVSAVYTHICRRLFMFLESGDKHRFLYAYINPVQVFADQIIIYFSGPYKLRWVKMPEKHMQSGNDQCCVWGKLPFSSTLIIRVKNSGILWYDCVLKSGLNLY